MKSKTIILSSQKKFANNSPRAIVTFISNSKLEGKLRLYNIEHLPPESKLGIYYDNKVYTANLFKKDGAYGFLLDENFNLDNNIYCAIIDKENNNDVVLCGGTSNNFNYNIVEDIEPPQKEITEEEVEIEKIIDENLTNNMVKQESSNNDCDDCDNCATCDNCIYKEYFYSHHKKEEQKKELKADIQENLTPDRIVEKVEINELPHNPHSENNVNTLNKESERFLTLITDQLDDMFNTYPEDNEIMKIIPNSKVIKVTDTIDQSPYIVGVIYENSEIKYLLYGVPSKYNDPIPTELGENYQWLPLHTEDPMSDGYYVLYQDASTGRIVPIIVE